LWEKQIGGDDPPICYLEKINRFTIRTASNLTNG